MNFSVILHDIKSFQSRLVGNRTGRALTGLLVDYVGTAASMGLSFVAIPLLLALLSAPMYGFWIVTSQIIFFLNLLDGGASINLIKGIADAKQSGQMDRLKHLITTTFWSYMFLGGIALALGLSLSSFIAGWAKIDPTEASAATTAFQIAVVTLSISLIAVTTFYGILQGYQRIALVNGIVYSVNILSLLSALALLYLHLGIEAMALGQLGATLLGAVVAFSYARRICPALSLAPQNFRWAELRQIFRFTGYFQMSKLAFVASAYSDGILLAGSYGAASVTTYSLTQKLASTASMFVNKVGGVLIPGFTELFAGQEIARLQPVVVRLTRLLTRIGFLNLLLILILNERFVGIWVGPATFGGLALTALFAYSVFRNGLIRNLAALFFSSGRLEGWGWLSLIEAIVKISLTLVFLPTLGLLAPMIGTIIAELFTGVYTPIRVAQLVRLPLSSLLTQGIGLPLLKSVPTIVVLGVLNYLVPLQSRWFGIVFIGFCGVLANTLSFDWAQWKNGWSRLMRVMSSKPRRSVDH